MSAELELLKKVHPQYSMDMPPLVRFYDNAVIDAEATEKLGRHICIHCGKLEYHHSETNGNSEASPTSPEFLMGIRIPTCCEEPMRPAPRFKEVVYVQIQPRHPDLSVRDKVSKLATRQHKQQFAKEWAEYEARKATQNKMTPSIEAIPGIGVAAIRELETLGIYDCQAMLDSPHDLGELERYRTMARRIIDAVTRKEPAVAPVAPQPQVNGGWSYEVQVA